MATRIGALTGGGDCPGGLEARIRGVVRSDMDAPIEVEEGPERVPEAPDVHGPGGLIATTLGVAAADLAAARDRGTGRERTAA